jgi:hypothetical protein
MDDNGIFVAECIHNKQDGTHCLDDIRTSVATTTTTTTTTNNNNNNNNTATATAIQRRLQI